MRADWLTVKLVEELQRSLERSQPVAKVVAQLKGATLSGLSEYGCLRFSISDGSLPDLPPAIGASPLGRALLAVRSDLGLRSDGPPKRPLRRLDPQTAEFQTIEGEADLAGENWELFAGRFDASARRAGFSFDVAAKLQLALYEMAENAVIHAEASAILVGYHALPGTTLFCVADAGIGVLASLRKNPAFRGLHRHNEAIRTALQDGKTSRLPEEGGGGFGFRQVFTSLTDQWGSLRFRSGMACITMEGTDFDTDRGSVSYPPSLSGFQVTVCCRTHAPTATHGHPLI